MKRQKEFEKIKYELEIAKKRCSDSVENMNIQNQNLLEYINNIDCAGKDISFLSFFDEETKRIDVIKYEQAQLEEDFYYAYNNEKYENEIKQKNYDIREEN